MIIDGKKIAEKLYDSMKLEIEKINNKPTLGAILVGENSSSIRYINQKKKWADYVGIIFELKTLSKDITEIDLLKEIECFNKDEKISGYIVQLPLPNHINSKNIINAILPNKDIDGFHPENQGKVMIGDNSGFAPCTPAGIMYILKTQNIELAGKDVVVIGRSNIVGKPVANLLINAGATVVVCNSKTKDIESYTKKADIVICAAGVPSMLKKDMINESTIIIDVGFTIINGKIYGDADFDTINDNGNQITPVPGGVGPLTVANLISNTIKAGKI